MQKAEIVFLVGPTAVGKTETAIHLAKKMDAEIISCDSMQVYKGMDIITAKPPPALRKKVAHYLIDVVAPTTEYNVFRYRREALKKIEEIIKKGKTPLFSGGTGMYMSILLDGIFKAGSQNKVIRRQLYNQNETRGGNYLYKRLQKIDPVSARKIHPNDTRRIVRALEVFRATGKPISELQRQRKGLNDEYNVRIFCLNMERDKLCRRIEGRIGKMFKRGLLREVKQLLKLNLSKTALASIGIREIEGYLSGLYGLEEAKRLMEKNTRNYAKRQLTWFRKDKRIEWIQVSEKESSLSVANRIYNELKQPHII